MDDAGNLSRRQFGQFTLSGAAAAAVVLTGYGAQRASASVVSAPAARAAAAARPATVAAPSRIAYCMLLNQGQWTGPVTKSGQPALHLIDEILKKSAGYAVPTYMRMTSAPSSGTGVPAKGTVGLQVLQQLAGGGIKLGVAIDTYGNGRSANSVITQAKKVLAASENVGGVYDWIFLDHASDRTPAGHEGLNDLQDIVDGVAAAGWSRIMINATGFGPSTWSYLPERTWGMAKHYDLFDGNWRAAVQQVVKTKTGEVTSGDKAFIDYVTENRAGSAPILKLEVSSESLRFRQLSVSDQTTLLELWAQQGPQLGFHNIYPIFIPNGNPADVYDSLTVGTFWEQRSLMQQYG